MLNNQEKLASSIYYDPLTFEKLISILEKFEDERSFSDLRFLREALGQIEFWRQLQSCLEEDVQLNLVKEIKLKELDKEDVVFYTGDPGSHFFMLLQGSVYIIKESNLGHRSNNPSTERSPRKSLTNKVHSGVRRGSILKLLDYAPPLETDEDAEDHTPLPLIEIKKENPILSPEELHQLFPGNLVLNTLYAPNYFGEIALNESLPRTATVVCREKCYLATLKRSTYLRVLIEHFEKILKEKLDFFKAVPLMKSWLPENISALIRNVEIEKFKYGQTIFKQNDEAKDLYFVKSGTVELFKEIEIDICNIDQMFVNSAIFKKVSYNDVQLYKSINPLWKKKVRRNECLRVAIVSPGEILGDLDIAKMSRRRECTAKCLDENVEVYKIERNVFFMNSNAPEEVLYKIRDNNPKKDWRDNFLTKLVRKKENKWGNYQKILASCQTIDPFKEVKRVAIAVDVNLNNLTERERRGRAIRTKESPPPFARSTKSEDLLRNIPRETSLEFRSIFENTRKKEFLRSKASEERNLRQEVSNRTKFGLKNEEEKEKKEEKDKENEEKEEEEEESHNSSRNSNFNFVTTKIIPKRDSGLNASQSVQITDNNKSETKLPSIKRRMKLSQPQSNISMEYFSTQPDILLNERGSFRMQKTKLTAQLAGNESTFQPIDTSRRSVHNLTDRLNSQRNMIPQELKSKDEQKNRILNSLRIPELSRKQPILFHKLLGNQASWKESRRGLTDASLIEQAKSSARIETLRSESTRDRICDTFRERSRDLTPKVSYTAFHNSLLIKSFK